jgi:hypothetical protein
MCWLFAWRFFRRAWRDVVRWSEQKGELHDYAPKGSGVHSVRSGGLLGSHVGSTLVVRLVSGLDRCKE